MESGDVTALGIVIVSVLVLVFVVVSNCLPSGNKAQAATTEGEETTEKDREAKRKAKGKAKQKPATSSRHGGKQKSKTGVKEHANLVRVLKGHQDTIADVCAVDQALITSSKDRVLRAFNDPYGEETPRFARLPVEGDYVEHCALSEGALYLGCSTHGQKRLQVYGVVQGHGKISLKLLKESPRNMTTLPSLCMCINEQRRLLVGLEKDGILLYLLGGDMNKPLKRIKTNQVQNYTASLSPDGTWIALGAFTAEVRLYRLSFHKTTGAFEGAEAVTVLPGHTKGCKSIAWSGDSRTVATCAGDSTVRLWNMDVRHRDGEDVKCIFSLSVAQLAAHACVEELDAISMSKDAKWLAMRSGAHLVVMNVNDPQPVANAHVIEEAHGGAITCMDWMGSQGQLVTGSEDHTVKLWKFE